jgi:class 3 adenylate cyclase
MTPRSEAGSDLERAHGLFRDSRWREAYELLSEIDRLDGLDASGLDELSAAAWLSGEFVPSLDASERSYRASLQQGDYSSAAVVALMLAWEHENRGEQAQTAGWTARAVSLLANQPESLGHGWMAWWQARERLYDGHPEDALSLLERSGNLARSFGDPDLEAVSRWYSGRALAGAGQLDEGFALIDEAMAAVTGGELTVVTAGAIYCLTVTLCRAMGDYRRASEWTEAQRRWCERESVAVFPTFCRVNRAGIMRIGGAWPDAEQEALIASRELETIGYPSDLGDAIYEIGELHRCRGDLAAAEQAFRRTRAQGCDALPGLALLRLGQGHADDARRLLEGGLDEAAEAMWEVRLLPALVEVAVAQGDHEAALTAWCRLETIAETANLPVNAAWAATARGQIELASRNGAAARTALRHAVRLWRDDVRAPYEAARAQVLLAQACEIEDDRDGAGVALRAALATFKRLGAGLDATAAVRRLAEIGEHAEAPAVATAERAFLFTDIVSSTALVEVIGDEAWQQLVRWHDATLRAEFVAQRGEEVDHAGDGFFVAFPDTDSAIAAAIAIQQRLAGHRRDAGFAPSVRIGIHTCTAVTSGREYRGKGVHTAARIAAAASGGEILISTTGVDGERMPGQRRQLALKGVTQPVEVVAVSWRP